MDKLEFQQSPEVTRLSNRLDKMLKVKWQIASLHRDISRRLESDQANNIISDIEKKWGAGVGIFIKNNIPPKDERFPLFALAALVCKEQATADIKTKFLEDWHALKENLGLNSTPEEIVRNFPRCHNRNWKVIYLGMILDFFESAATQTYSTENDFAQKYVDKLVAPAINIFQAFCAQPNIWDFVNQRLAILAGNKQQEFKQHISSLASDHIFTPAVFCVPYYLRRLSVPIIEQYKINRENLGYLFNQSVVVLEAGVYYRARKLQQDSKN